MRAAAIFGLDQSPRQLRPFQIYPTIQWRIGVPAAGEAEIVLIFGGDGTIHRNLTQLVALKTPVLVVPTGSGNDFARALGLLSVPDSLHAWERFCRGENNVRMIDLGLIRPLEKFSKNHNPAADAPEQSHYFCSVAGIGLDAEVMRLASHLPRWLRGHGGYALSLAPALFRFAPLRMKIFTGKQDSNHPDERSWYITSDQPTVLAAFANTPFYGSGMKIAPNARFDDGLLDICVISGIDPFKLACLFPTVYFGRHLQVRGVSYFQSEATRIDTERPLDVYADGEFVCRTLIEISSQKQCLPVIVAK